MNRRPVSWSQAKLDAFQEFIDVVQAIQTLQGFTALAGSTPEAKQIITDLEALAKLRFNEVVKL